MLRKLNFKHHCIQWLQVKSRIAAKLPEPSLNTIDKTADDKVHPIPLNEYTEMVNRTYLQLLASRVITKNKTS